MDIPSSLAIISLAALVHASFQLSVSVLTLLSGHSIGAKHSQARLLGLTFSFVIGAAVMTVLLLSFTTLILIQFYASTPPMIIWAAASGLLIAVALCIWLFYYRHDKGTVLWIPKAFSVYLNDRTKATKHNSEAFGLGLSSVLGELLFIIAPLLVSGLILIQLPAMWQLIGITIYTVISLLSLLIVWVLISSGHSLGKIQKWRESNKYFLQFVSGAGLIVLVLFIYAFEIMGSAVGLS